MLILVNEFNDRDAIMNTILNIRQLSLHVVNYIHIACC